MGKPTAEELDTALQEAARLREKGEDQHYLGKTLLNHHYRLDLHQELLVAARRYLHSGESSRAHQALVRALERAERADRSDSEPDWPAGL
jgi:hypothetical protein